MKLLKKVLIVDDSSTMRQVLLKELLKLNFAESNITQVEDGREAIKMVLDKHFDIIFMDWNMPHILGIDAVKAIRAAGIQTPILMITTESERVNVISAIQAGANNYLVKPFSSHSLHEKVIQLVQGVEAYTPTDLKDTTVDFEEGLIREN